MKKDYIVDCLASAVITLVCIALLWFLCIGFAKVFDMDAAKCWFIFSSLIIGGIIFHHLSEDNE